MTAVVSSSPKPAPSVSGLSAYDPPQPDPRIDLRLGGTERVVFPPALAGLVPELAGETLRRYPDPRDVVKLIAERHRVEPERVLVTAGGDEALDRACRAFLAPGRSLLVFEPTFEMIAHYGRLAGARIKTVVWPGGAALPVTAVSQAVDETTAAIAVVSPNNPTGTVARVEELKTLARSFPGVLLIVDLAYVEFADEDPTASMLAFPNAVVVRTLSKAWGAPGIRVGYALGSKDVLSWMRAAGGPYSVSRPSLSVAAWRLAEGEGELVDYVRQVRKERSALRELLLSLDVEVDSSQANFLLLRCGKRGHLVHDALAALGISVRLFPKQANLTGALRMSCPGDEQALERVSAALRAVLRPEALLFDLDGVLADVSSSYRQAILQTAQHFGARVTPEDIVKAKAAGHANNDWELTCKLLEQRGVSCSLSEVTQHFEQLYQGTATQPGLCQTERLLGSKELLERLAGRLPLGVVTGRPHKDAEKFLRTWGIRDLFTTLVCMEDAPEKPDPAPVRLCLERLGVRSAWMVGDTPDDVHAARSAGVVPFGVIPPGDNQEVQAPALQRAGAVRVLESIAALEELLS